MSGPKDDDEGRAAMMAALEELRASMEKARAVIARTAARTPALDAQTKTVVSNLDKLLADAQAWRASDQSGNSPGVVAPTKHVTTTKHGVRVSMRAVARAVGISHVLLLQARAGKRRIRKSIAEKIAAITPDLPATRKTWPLGWVEED